MITPTKISPGWRLTNCKGYKSGIGWFFSYESPQELFPPFVSFFILRWPTEPTMLSVTQQSTIISNASRTDLTNTIKHQQLWTKIRWWCCKHKKELVFDKVDVSRIFPFTADSWHKCWFHEINICWKLPKLVEKPSHNKLHDHLPRNNLQFFISKYNNAFPCHEAEI